MYMSLYSCQSKHFRQLFHLPRTLGGEVFIHQDSISVYYYDVCFISSTFLLLDLTVNFKIHVSPEWITFFPIQLVGGICFPSLYFLFLSQLGMWLHFIVLHTDWRLLTLNNMQPSLFIFHCMWGLKVSVPFGLPSCILNATAGHLHSFHSGICFTHCTVRLRRKFHFLRYFVLDIPLMRRIPFCLRYVCRNILYTHGMRGDQRLFKDACRFLRASSLARWRTFAAIPFANMAACGAPEAPLRLLCAWLRAAAEMTLLLPKALLCCQLLTIAGST